jgi:DNA/RNA-binding domain of Phe-tRNA-synthetase-like protein
MIELTISDEFRHKWPTIQLACLEADVEVMAFHAALWKKIDELSVLLRNTKKVEEISQTPAIAASRKAYKTLGKDPARYRLSAEALMRRVIKGADLYQINNVVDIINLASVTSGFSIGGYDADKISGTAELGIGKADEVYIGLGRGELNIEGLSVLRDAVGAFGSPTSDSERTGITLGSKRLLMVYYGFGAFEELPKALDFAEQLLVQFAGARNVERLMIM